MNIPTELTHSGYNSVLLYFNLNSLNDRGNYVYYIFLLKLLKNSYDCPYLLERLNFRINSESTRNQNIFLINNGRKKIISY